MSNKHLPHPAAARRTNNKTTHEPAAPRFSFGKNLRRAAISLLLLSTLLLPTSCADDTDDLYANERAFLRFTPVTAVPVLYAALGSYGQWCTMTYTASLFTFTSAEGTTSTYPMTAVIKNYGQIQCVNGFIIGTPSVPDMNLNYAPVCYELACPNCYRNDLIQKSLTLTTGEHAHCPRCGRTYDLANSGAIIEGDNGQRLMRYRMTYTGTLLVVAN